MVLPQTALILLRNNMYILFSCHLAGMVFYLIARLEHFRPESWVGRNYERFDGLSLTGRYIYSLYFSMAAFSGLGDNDFYVASVPEAVVMLVYLLFNLLLGAYILGTVTMLLTKGDKRMKLFRDRVTNLRSYGKINELPQRLMTAMEAHVELHFQSEQASDEQVLAIFPQTIRRRVLRHLYIKPIKECHLFAGCKPKYLDAVLAAGRVELFMPREQIIADGDIVNEIIVLLEG
ncbi:cyclic nucleotide-binding domain-containing protein, partial [Haematococcus lacustris]